MANEKLPRYQISAIYVITNTVTNDMYIGSALNPKKRWYNHITTLEKNKNSSTLLQRNYNKYGKENFTFDIIEIVKDKNKLIEREQVWIDFFNPKLNILKIAGSRLGSKHSEETKKKMSESRKGLNTWTTGRKFSQELKDKLSQIRKGKNTKKVIIDGVFFNSMKEAGEYYGLTSDYVRLKIRKGFFKNVEYVK